MKKSSSALMVEADVDVTYADRDEGGLLMFLASVETLTAIEAESTEFDGPTLDVDHVLRDAAIFVQPDGVQTETLKAALALCRSEKGALGTDQEIVAQLLSEARSHA